MLRVYLDTNLLTKINNYPLLKEKLESYHDYLNIVYSSAHIDDLQRSGDVEKTQKDLATIKEYSEDQCLAKYGGIEHLTYDTRDPFEFFETCNDAKIDLSNIFNSADEKLRGLGISANLNSLFKNNGNSVISQNQNQTFFQKFQTEGTFESLVGDVLEMLHNSQSNNDLLKFVRESFDKDLPRKVLGNVQENVFDFLNQQLPETTFKKTFDQLTIDSLKLKNKDKSASRFDQFITSYNMLDLVGYKSDNKSNIPNIVSDSFHAFYAAHCDIFLSEDKRLRGKAKVIYEEFNIDTLIFSEKEFCEYVDQLIVKINGIETILVDIFKHIIELPVQTIYSSVENRSTIKNYFLQVFFAGYFDHLFWVETIENYRILTFFKHNKTYSNWIYSKELKSLVKTFINILGPDINNNHEFQTESQEFSDQKTWIGRNWQFENFSVILDHDKEFGIVLRLEFMCQI